MPEPPRLLLVDDEPGMLDMLRWALCRQGYELSQARDGEAALRRLDEGGVDLVITDLTMPQQGGLDLLRALARRPASPPVIVVTGFGTVETAVEAMRLGARDFLLKPYDLDLLLARVRECLHEKTRAAPVG